MPAKGGTDKSHVISTRVDKQVKWEILRRIGKKPISIYLYELISKDLGEHDEFNSDL